MKTKLILAVCMAIFVGLWPASSNAAVSSMSVSAQSATNAPGGAQTYAITISGTGSADVTFTITNPLPPGVTATFNPNPVAPSGGAWITNAVLTLTTSAATPPGTYTFTIRATPSGGGASAVAGQALVVNIPTATSLSSSANLAMYGEAVTFTAIVAPIGAGTPTGTVTLLDGSTALASGPIDGAGQAVFSINNLNVSGSPHSVTAVYSGDSAFQGSTSVAVSETITPVSLFSTGVAALSKTYDGSASVLLDFSGALLLGVVNGDDVNLDASAAIGSFADKYVGAGKPVVVTGLALSGADAGNYTLAQPSSITSSIAPRPLVISATGVDKVYDGTTVASVSLTDNCVSGDEVSLSYSAANFADRDVGTAKLVSVTGIAVSGKDAANYTFYDTAAAQANVTPRSLTVTAMADTKVYDGTTASALTPLIGGAGLVAGDTAAFAQTFDNPNTGTGKILTPNGAVSDGNNGLNYTVTLATASGSIAAARLTIKADDKMKVVGIANPDLTVTYSGFVADENASVLTRQATLATSADINSPAGEYPITVSGATAQNYEIVYLQGVLTILLPPVLVAAEPLGNSFIFRFDTVLSQRYQVQACDSLPAAAWTPVGDILTGTGESLTVTQDLGGGNKFFRVEALPRAR